MIQDLDAMIRDLECMDRLRRATIQQAIDSLHIQPAARILDIGCGVGLQALQIAQAVSTPSRVIGLDICPALLKSAHARTAQSLHGDCIRLASGDMRQLPFADNSVDLCWSADCLGYPAAQHLPLLEEAVRVAKPGATIAVLAWSSQALLPGHAMLEARLNATASAYAPYLDQSTAEQHFMRLGHGLSAAGLHAVGCRTFVGEVAAPLDQEQRAALSALFEMLWGSALNGASTADQYAFERLCRPGSPNSILDLEDYCGFFTYTMFTGAVRK